MIRTGTRIITLDAEGKIIKEKQHMGTLCQFGDELKILYNHNRDYKKQSVRLEILECSEGEKNILPISSAGNDSEDSFWKVKINHYYVFRFRIMVFNEVVKKTSYGPVNTLIVYCKHDPFFRRRSMNIMTIMPNLFPKEIKNWLPLIGDMTERGYNAFHFGPLQCLGDSRSIYSVRDHRHLNPMYSKKGDNPLKTTPSVENYKFPHNLKFYSQAKTNDTWVQLSDFVSKAKKRHDATFFTDIVLNHCSTESDWIREPKNSNAFYNVGNTPYLRPALLVDQALLRVGKDIVKKLFAGNHNGTIHSESKVDEVMVLVKEAIASLRIQEFFMIHPTEYKVKGAENNDSTGFKKNSRNQTKSDIEIFDDECLKNVGHARFGIVVDLRRHKLAKGQLQFLVEVHNENAAKEYGQYMTDAICWNLRNFLLHGKFYPELPIADANGKVFPKYFHDVSNGASKDDASFAVLNGWLKSPGPSIDLLYKQGLRYLRREVEIWEDLIKFNFDNFESKTNMVQYFDSYFEICFDLFDGFRIDNYHNTHQECIDYFRRKLKENARESKRQMILLVELFVNSQEEEIAYCEKIGAHYLTKELIHYRNPTPIPWQSVQNYNDDNRIFFIQTHDNDTYFEANKVDHILPFTADCYFNTNEIHYGCTLYHDEMTKKKFETSYWNEEYKIPGIGQNSQSFPTHKIENFNERVIWYNGKEGDGNVMVHGSWNNWSDGYRLNKVQGNNFAAKVRMKPGKHEFKFTVNGHWTTCSNYPISEESEHGNHVIEISDPGNVQIADKIDIYKNGIGLIKKQFTTLRHQLERFDFIEKSVQYLDWQTHAFQFLYSVEEKGETTKIQMTQVLIDTGESGTNSILNTLGDISSFEVYYLMDGTKTSLTADHVYIRDSELSRYGFLNGNQLVLNALPQICVVVVKSNFVVDYAGFLNSTYSLKDMNCFKQSIFTIDELNTLLYSCDKEEKMITKGNGSYFLPHYGQFKYAGLTSLIKVFEEVDGKNKIRSHLTEGLWLVEFYFDRILRVLRSRASKSQSDIVLLERLRATVVNLPTAMVFVTFKKVMKLFYNLTVESLMRSAELTKNQMESEFIRNLTIASPQFFSLGTLSAGLPHFCEGVWKQWGRDTFISVQGLLLALKRYSKAQEIILDYAKYVTKGLVPNLKQHENYDSRDATWWYFYSIGKYIELSGDYDILEEVVTPLSTKTQIKLIDLLQEMMEMHLNSKTLLPLKFDLASGFEISKTTKLNLTWMDKKGDGVLNKGIPATPRVGAPIELTALSWYAFNLMHSFSQKSIGKAGVEITTAASDSPRFWTYRDLALKVETNFESYYYNAEKKIYNDTALGLKEEETRLRCNAVIATSVMFDVLNRSKVREFIKVVEKELINPNSLGIMTLERGDPVYRSYYNNADQSDDYWMQGGFSYHNGPEWVWLYGFYLSTVKKIKGVKKGEIKELIPYLTNHAAFIKKSEWASIPELTNHNGDYCNDSCPAQAWSIGTLLECLLLE